MENYTGESFQSTGDTNPDKTSPNKPDTTTPGKNSPDVPQHALAEDLQAINHDESPPSPEPDTDNLASLADEIAELLNSQSPSERASGNVDAETLKLIVESISNLTPTQFLTGIRAFIAAIITEKANKMLAPKSLPKFKPTTIQQDGVVRDYDSPTTPPKTIASQSQ